MFLQQIWPAGIEVSKTSRKGRKGREGMNRVHYEQEDDSRFMVPVRFEKNVEAFHEPRCRSVAEASPSPIGWERVGVRVVRPEFRATINQAFCWLSDLHEAPFAISQF
jgi:hypothetical protein